MSLFHDLIERARTLLFRKREERELAEELRFHIEMETEKNRKLGMSPIDARRESMLALGGVEHTKEQVRDARGTRLMHDSSGDVTLAIRALRRSPGFAIVAILTLGIGVGATTAVFSAVDAVLLQPLPYQQPGQLVRLYQYSGKTIENSFVTPVHFLDYRDRLTSFASTAATLTYSTTSADVGGAERPHRVQLLPVSAQYFDVVRVHPEIGRGFRTEDESDVKTTVLSHALWVTEMNSDANAVGKQLTMSGEPYTIIGVMPASYRDPLIRNVDAWVPMNMAAGKDVTNADNHYLSVLARLRPTATLASAQAELDVLSATLANLYPDAKETRAHIVALKEDLVGSSSRSLKLVLGAVLLVLVLACVNIANLLLVRGSERAREFAIRAALGGQRSRLVRQLLVESLVLSTAGAIAGIAIARGAMTAIVAMGNGAIPRLSTLELEPRLLLFSVLIASLSAVVFGLAPALRTTRTQPTDVLREQSRATTGGKAQGRMREALVISQVALAFVLLSGAGVLVASFRELQQVDLGMKMDHALTFELRLPTARYDSTARALFYDEFARETSKLPGVKAVGGTSRLPATGSYHSWGTTALSGPFVGTEKARVRPTPEQRTVSGQYFDAAGMHLLSGRLFDARDVMGSPTRVIISRSLAQAFYPGVSAIGQTLRFAGTPAEVIGVVSDVAINVEGRIANVVYHPHSQFAGNRNWELTQVVATTGDPTAIISAVRSVVSKLDPQLVMHNPTPLADAIGRGNASRVFILQILSLFAAIALALSALGLFGVLSYGVKLRSREFGIRMALGADRGAIRGLVMRRGLGVTAIGIGCGLIGAFALSRVMASMVFKVKPLDPTVLVISVLFMCAVAAIAAFIPAYRATAVDPRAVLQGE